MGVFDPREFLSVSNCLAANPATALQPGGQGFIYDSLNLTFPMILDLFLLCYIMQRIQEHTGKDYILKDPERKNA